MFNKMGRLAFVAVLVIALTIVGRSGASSTELSLTASATPSPATTTILVPKGTLIVVETTRSYKSYGASNGTKVTYDVVQDVIVSGTLIAQAGDAADGEILNSHEGSTNWLTGETKGANLRVSVDEVYNFCGDSIKMDFARSEFRNRQGLFGGKMDVEISKGQRYRVPTERAQRVCGLPTSEQPLPMPSDALEGDQS